MRYHELAVQYWLSRWAIVREGYPVPVVFSSPLDALSHFAQLWARDNNPFNYLLDLKDETGKPLYEPHPSPVRYPLISVKRLGWKYRTEQNFSIHRWRHVNWPTVSDAGPVIPGKEQLGTGLERRDLGEVMTARRPMAWNYSFQIDHYCNRPDTQAFFIDQLMDQLWRTGGTPQTWIEVDYPGYGKMLVRLYLAGDIDNTTPETPANDGYMEFRTSVTVVLEGFNVDTRFKIYPAFWTLIFGEGSSDAGSSDAGGPLPPDQLQILFTEDSRRYSENPTVLSRPGMPPLTSATTFNQEIEVLPFSLDVGSQWQAEGVLLPLALDATLTWEVVPPDQPEEVDATLVWDVLEVAQLDAVIAWSVEEPAPPEVELVNLDAVVAWSVEEPAPPPESEVVTLDASIIWDSAMPEIFSGLAAYDEFDRYAVEDPVVNTLNGGYGWDGPWQISGTGALEALALDSPLDKRTDSRLVLKSSPVSLRRKMQLPVGWTSITLGFRYVFLQGAATITGTPRFAFGFSNAAKGGYTDVSSNHWVGMHSVSESWGRYDFGVYGSYNPVDLHGLYLIDGVPTNPGWLKFDTFPPEFYQSYLAGNPDYPRAVILRLTRGTPWRMEGVIGHYNNIASKEINTLGQVLGAIGGSDMGWAAEMLWEVGSSKRVDETEGVFSLITPDEATNGDFDCVDIYWSNGNDSSLQICDVLVRATV